MRRIRPETAGAADLKPIWTEYHSPLKVFGLWIRQIEAVATALARTRGYASHLKDCAMTILEDVLSSATAPIAWRRASIFLVRTRRLINGLVAAAIARRERHAMLAVLGHLNGRELKDFGLDRSQISLGLDQAAQERARIQLGVRAAGLPARSVF